MLLISSIATCIMEKKPMITSILSLELNCRSILKIERLRKIMIINKGTCRIVAVLLVLIFAFMLSGCGILKKAAELSEYEVGGESIPSITSVVGERKVTGVESKIENGVTMKQYTYESTSVFDDLWAYITKCREDGWLITEDIDLHVTPGSGQLGKESSDDGKILVIAFAYEDGKYAIKITKGDGTLNVD